MSNLSNDELDTLLELAKAATPGTWYRDIKSGFHVTVRAHAYGRGIATTFVQNCPRSADGMEKQTVQNNANADFIAAANPATITALVQQLQEAQRDAARLNHLQERGATVALVFDGEEIVFQVGGLHAATSGDLREAIDIAMEITKERQP